MTTDTIQALKSIPESHPLHSYVPAMLTYCRRIPTHLREDYLQELATNILYRNDLDKLKAESTKNTAYRNFVVKHSHNEAAFQTFQVIAQPRPCMVTQVKYYKALRTNTLGEHNFTPETVQALQGQVHAQSLNTPVAQESDTSFQDLLEAPELDYDLLIDCRQIQRALRSSQISETDKEILRASTEPGGQTRLAEEYGISRQALNERYKQAIVRLRVLLKVPGYTKPPKCAYCGKRTRHLYHRPKKQYCGTKCRIKGENLKTHRTNCEQCDKVFEYVDPTRVPRWCNPRCRKRSLKG